MALKRTVTLDATTPIQVAKRLKRIERKQNLYGPTKLVRAIVTTDAGNLADGALRAVQLSLFDSKTVRVSIKGYLGGQNVDAYLVQTPTTTAPVYADFTPTIGGCLTVDAGPSNKGLAVWKHYLSLNGGANFSIVQKFKFGFETTYDSSGLTATGKQLWLVFKNDSGAGVSPQATIEYFYSSNVNNN